MGSVLTSPDAQLDRVSDLAAERDRVAAELALAVTEAERAGAWQAAGARSGHRWLQAYTYTSRRDASVSMALGSLLCRFETTAAAVCDAELPVSHGNVLAGVVRAHRLRFYRRDEHVLLEQATKLPRVGDFEQLVAHWCALVDQEAGEPSLEPAQRLFLQHRLDGGVDVRGALDAATAAIVRTGLEAFDSGPDPRDGPTTPRTLAERRADALGDIVAHSLAHLDHCSTVPEHDESDPDWNREPNDDDDAHDGDDYLVLPDGPDLGDDEHPADELGSDAAAGDTPGSDNGARPNPTPFRLPVPPRRPRVTLNAIIDLASLAGRLGGADIDGIMALIDGKPVAIAAVERLLCGSIFAATVTDATGRIISATTDAAAFTDTQRRRVAARDRTCRFPGCDSPPSWCDVHHLHARHAGGTRTIDNLILLCRRHHRFLHSGWQLRRAPERPGEWNAIAANGRRWTGRPPLRQQREPTESAGPEPPDTG